MTEFVEIDGSFGEGGGQILRTTLSLSCITGKPVRIFNIRKNRPKPGLMPQHLMSVEALARISGAEVRGTGPNSQEISFKPGPVTAGEYLFEIGTAGSVALLLQSLLPPLLFAKTPSRLVLTGGTHVPSNLPLSIAERQRKAAIDLLAAHSPAILSFPESPPHVIHPMF